MKFGDLTKYEADGQKVMLDFEGRAARIEVLTPYIVNVFGAVEGERTVSKAIEGDKAVPVSIRTEEE